MYTYQENACCSIYVDMIYCMGAARSSAASVACMPILASARIKEIDNAP
jgi:hypothetical protein